MNRSPRSREARRLNDARALARGFGLVLVVHRYGQRPGDADVWALHADGVEVGHWVPATRHYRVRDYYGGPMPFARVCACLATINLTNRKTA